MEFFLQRKHQTPNITHASSLTKNNNIKIFMVSKLRLFYLCGNPRKLSNASSSIEILNISTGNSLGSRLLVEFIHSVRAFAVRVCIIKSGIKWLVIRVRVGLSSFSFFCIQSAYVARETHPLSVFGIRIYLFVRRRPNSCGSTGNVARPGI